MNFARRYDSSGNIVYEIEGDGSYADGEGDVNDSTVWFTFGSVGEVDEFIEFVKRELRKKGRVETKEMLIADIKQLSDLIWKKYAHVRGKVVRDRVSTRLTMPLGFFGAYRYSLVLPFCYAPLELVHGYTEPIEKLDKRRIGEIRDFLVCRLKDGIPD